MGELPLQGTDAAGGPVEIEGPLLEPRGEDHPLMPEKTNSRSARGDGEKQRLWEHRLHEDLILSDRQNFFLVAQSLLIVAEAELLGQSETVGAAILAGAGLLLTATRFFVIRRQRAIVLHLQARALESLPEFSDTYETRPAGLSSTAVFVTVAPGLVAAVWILLLVIALV